MLHISFNKLPTCCSQEVLAGQRRSRIDKRHSVLKLVAKSKSTSGLIQRRASPKAATQGLIEQPSVQQEIDRKIRGFYLDRAQELVPPLFCFRERPLHTLRVSESLYNGPY